MPHSLGAFQETYQVLVLMLFHSETLKNWEHSWLKGTAFLPTLWTV